MNSDERERLAKVETRLKTMERCLVSVKEDVQGIIKNELPHLREAIAEVRTEVKVNSVKVAAIVGALSAVVSAILNWLLK